MEPIAHIKQPNYPQFRFEWHPESRPNTDAEKGTVYVVRTTTPMGEPVFAEPLAWNIQNPGAAQNVVLIWLRGYQAGKAEINGWEQQAAESNYVCLA